MNESQKQQYKSIMLDIERLKLSLACEKNPFKKAAMGEEIIFLVAEALELLGNNNE